MAYNTNYPITCPIDNKVLYCGDCFERCMSACREAPKNYMPGLKSFEEEAAICKACEHYQDD